jgi:hypothetical protein
MNKRQRKKKSKKAINTEASIELLMSLHNEHIKIMTPVWNQQWNSFLDYVYSQAPSSK